MENHTKRKTEKQMKMSANQMEKNMYEDLITNKGLLELRRVLKVISTVPRGLNPHIKEFIHTALSLQAVQSDDGAADSLKGGQAVPSLSLEVLITQLERTLEKIQAANCNGHQLNMDYYLTLLFLYGLALIERGTKQDFSEAKSKFMTMKMKIQKKEDCRNFLSLVYFGCGLLLGTQKRYNGGLLEFQKSKQEIKDNNENWYGIDHIKDEDLPQTFQDLLDDYIKKYENHIEMETICSSPDCERSCEADIFKKSKYKGFVHLICSENCSIYFHRICWEKLKNINHSGKSDESFCEKTCLKKGCTGNIVKMRKCEGLGVFVNLFDVSKKDECMQSCLKKSKTLPATEATKIQKLNLKGKGVAVKSGLNSHSYNPEEVFQDEILEQNASPINSIKDMKSDPEELPGGIPKDEKSAPSESSIESIKDVQESAQVNSKSKKKKKNKTKKNKEPNKEHSPNVFRNKEEAGKVQELNPQLSNGPEKKNPCDLQCAPAAEEESCCPTQSDTPDFPDQGSRNKPTPKHVKSQEGTREQLLREQQQQQEQEQQQQQQQQQLWEARRQCADLKKQLEVMILQWQQKQGQLKEKDKIISGLNQQVSSGNHKVSKLQQELQAKDSEIRKLKEKLASERSQWEREKNKLEAKAKKCLSKLNGETNRAITAEVWFLQTRRDFDLHQLEQTEREYLVQLIRATTMASSHPESLQLKAAVESWNTIVADVRNKIALSRTQYNEQITLVKNGYPLNCLPPIQIPPPPPNPDILMQHFLEKNIMKENSLRTTPNSPQFASSYSGASSAASQARPPLVTGMAQPTQVPVLGTGISEAILGNERTKISWERIMDKLKTAFPEYSRMELTDLLRKLKDANGRSLTGLTFDEIVRRVSQMIEPKRSQNQLQGVQSADSIPPSHPQPKPTIDQPPRSAWRPLNPQVPVAWEGTKNLGDDEEPCVICHDNLTPDNLCVLACAHKFHSQCIKPWLKRQGTCPTCRLYVVLPEEFPGLPSRHIPKI
ncbi:E3 ubiquitin-protein ligase DZIP3 [Dromiciops gliroides]|uniref:E3 ubiquitin-protein ligase DZIP3 n=1 Tax=Dromiciops gliroides TaxID=33562 RepID=UPI001CC77216|nr:E3 ubiquitin-protein ligase DZIP3 [Dromiciops gliroides]